MIISFDFDATLSRPDIQEIANDFVERGHAVYITTSRHGSWKWVGDNKSYNQDLFDVAEKVGIPECNIRFTEMEPKVDFLKGFHMHFDDDEVEIDMINRSDINCLGILVNYKSYKV